MLGVVLSVQHLGNTLRNGLIWHKCVLLCHQLEKEEEGKKEGESSRERGIQGERGRGYYRQKEGERDKDKEMEGERAEKQETMKDD